MHPVLLPVLVLTPQFERHKNCQSLQHLLSFWSANFHTQHSLIKFCDGTCEVRQRCGIYQQVATQSPRRSVCDHPYLQAMSKVGLDMSGLCILAGWSLLHCERMLAAKLSHVATAWPKSNSSGLRYCLWSG